MASAEKTLAEGHPGYHSSVVLPSGTWGGQKEGMVPLPSPKTSG